MNLHLYWRDKNWKEKEAADDYNLYVDMKNRTYKIWVNPFYGYISAEDIEVVRKSDITNYVKYLKRKGFTGED